MTEHTTTDDRVWVASTFSAGNNIYHTDPECTNLQMSKSTREADREQMDRKGARECKYCSGEVTRSTQSEGLTANGFDARRFNVPPTGGDE